MSLFDVLRKEEKIDRNKYEKTIADLLKKINIALKKEDYFRAAWLYGLASKIARRVGDLERSIEYSLQSAEYSLKERKYFNAGWSYRIAALSARKKKDWDKGIEYALKAAEYFLKDNNIYAACWSYNLAAEACKAKNDLYSAIKYYEKSLELQADKEIQQQIDELKLLIPHPSVDQCTSVSEAKEGEEIEFKITVENKSKEPIKNIQISGKKVENMETTHLLPNETKIFSYKTKGKVGRLTSPYKIVTWQTLSGDRFEDRLKPVKVRIKPNIQVNTYVPELVLEKQDELVVLLKNLSSSQINDVKLDVKFPPELEAKTITSTQFKRILPGGEKGAVWKIKPKVTGETRIDDCKLKFKDIYGEEYLQAIEPIIIKEVLEAERPMLEKETIKKEELMERKRYLQSSILKNPLSESEYVKFTKIFGAKKRGFSLEGVDLDVASEHVLEECGRMSLVSKHEFANEKLFLFSCKLATTDAQYLLTVVLKKENDLIHFAFKAYSDKEEGLEEFLNEIADIIRYIIIISTLAKEVERIEIKKVINIIDSIVQRSKIATDEGLVKEKKIKIKDSLVQRSNLLHD